jgi:predicted metal-binding membrane protein
MATAMMLPSAAPVASLYARSVRRNRPIRLGGFAAGYLLVWAASAVPAYGLARLADRAVAAAPAVGTVTAAVVFAANGAYQLSGLKDRCLSRCRSPFALLLRSAAWRGPFRDLRAGAHSGGSCLGCCWSLMALVLAFGVMNLWAMVLLTLAVTAEKLWSHGHGLAQATGLASLGLAVAVAWFPWLAPGLRAGAMAM